MGKSPQTIERLERASVVAEEISDLIGGLPEGFHSSVDRKFSSKTFGWKVCGVLIFAIGGLFFWGTKGPVIVGAVKSGFQIYSDFTEKWKHNETR